MATVHNSRNTPTDDHWGDIISEITLVEGIPDIAFNNIMDFSHLEIIYYFDKAITENIEMARRPRGNPNYPLNGIFAQRNKDRPNRIGLCTVKLIGHKGNTITVKNLDAIDETPVIDIKPLYKGFQAKGPIRQADWVTDLMKNYW